MGWLVGDGVGSGVGWLVGGGVGLGVGWLVGGGVGSGVGWLVDGGVGLGVDWLVGGGVGIGEVGDGVGNVVGVTSAIGSSRSVETQPDKRLATVMVAIVRSKRRGMGPQRITSIFSQSTRCRVDWLSALCRSD